MGTRPFNNLKTRGNNYPDETGRYVVDNGAGQIEISVKKEKGLSTINRTVQNFQRKDRGFSFRRNSPERYPKQHISNRSRSSSPNYSCRDTSRRSLKRNASLKKSISERLGSPVHPVKRKTTISQQPRSNKAMELRMKHIPKNTRPDPFYTSRPDYTTRSSFHDPISRRDRQEPPRVAHHEPPRSTRQKPLKGPRQTSTASKHSVPPRTRTNNLINKAKSKVQQSKQGLASITKAAVKDKKGESSKNLESFIQDILDQPDVKNMISTIAKQTLGSTIPSVRKTSPPRRKRGKPRDRSPDKPATGLTKSITPDKPATGLTKSLTRHSSLLNNASAILEKANNVCESFKRRNSFTPRKKSFPNNIPDIKYGKVSDLTMYCSTCKLGFTTPMLKCLHVKSEIHLLATGDWWKSHPNPPSNFNGLRKPVNIFCVICWLKIPSNSEKEKDQHFQTSKHRKNKGLFIEIFGKLPLFEWILWESLTQSFRVKFNNDSSEFPEYAYVPRLKNKT